MVERGRQYHLAGFEVLPYGVSPVNAYAESFGIRGFHDKLLGNGALPLNVLETHMNEWVAEQKAAAAE